MLLWIYIIGIPIAWILIVGLFHAEERTSFPRLMKDSRWRRETLGFNIILGLFYSIVWPVSIFLAFCLTGFAQDGWTLSLRGPNREEETYGKNHSENR